MTNPRVEICIDSQDPEALAPFWSAALGYGIGDMDSAGDYLDLVPPAGSAAPVVYLQRVPEPKSTKNRLHLDLYTADAQGLVARLETLGATRSGDPMSGSEGGWWQVMTDPAGNEFCVCRDETG